MSSIASSTVAKGASFSTPIAIWGSYRGLSGRQAFHVFREDVDLEVDLAAGLEHPERGHLERMPDERDVKSAVANSGDRQRDAVGGDRAFFDAVAQDLWRRLDRQPATVALGLDRRHLPDPVDMPLDVMAAERVSGSEGGLEIHLGAEGLRARKGLGHHIEGKRAVRALRDGEADPVD